MLARFIGLIVCLMIAPLAMADGLIIIHNPPAPIPGHFPFAPLQITYHRVDVTIDNNIATTTVDQEFRNPSPVRLEGTYLFPLPEGAHIDKFSMDISGKMADAELLDADKARLIYEDIVRRQRDPALLEYVGRGAFKARIFPIEPNSSKQIRIRYTQLLKTDNALTEYVYPLNTEKFSSTPLNHVSVKVHVKSDDHIKTLYCPSHIVQTQRDNERSATVTYDEKEVRPDTDFRLVYTSATKPVDIRLLTYSKALQEDGYFLLLASPGIDTPLDQVQPRDICFVIDTSGSMAGEKLKQAKKALRYCIANLNPNDRFQVIRFSTEAQPLWGELMKATPHAREKADAFIESFKAMGGTAIEDAFKAALRKSDDRNLNPPETGNPYVVVFLTDGQPTVGETNEDKLVQSAGKSANSRVFCFGIGDDINTHLLDRIAGNSNAFTTYVGAKEDIEVKVSGFFTGIQSPVLTNTSVAFTGADVRVYDMMPRVLPDLFKGQTLYVAGRYHGTGPAAVTVAGTLNGKAVRFAQDVNLSTGTAGHEYIAQLWATRRVGWLLDEIRLHGESGELKDEVTRLAREFGIVTPYTSYLIVEDEQRRNVPVAFQTMRELSQDAEARQRSGDFYRSNQGDSKMLAKSGPQGVTNAQTMHGMKGAITASPTASAAPAATEAMAKLDSAGAAKPSQGYRIATNYAQQARMVNGKAFYQNGNTWTDASAQTQKNLKQQMVKFGSEEYFALLKKNRNVAGWLALGTDVDIVVDDVLYQVRM